MSTSPNRYPPAIPYCATKFNLVGTFGPSLAGLLIWWHGTGQLRPWHHLTPPLRLVLLMRMVTIG